MPKPKIWISRPVVDVPLAALRIKFEVKVWSKSLAPTYEELNSNAKNSDGIIVMLDDSIDKQFIESNQHLKIISNYAVGYDNIDIETANKYKIAVSNTPDVLTQSTAELAFSLMLATYKNLISSNICIRNGEWKGWGPMDHLGESPQNKTIGILGAGRIGQYMATLCHRAFQMPVLYYSPSIKENLEKELKAKKVSLEELLQKSDVISLHAPLNSETKSLLDKNAFIRMKNSSILVNTARGGICQQDDLYNALVEGEIAGAGLDVTTPEPLSKDSPLLALKQCVITPHIGSATRSTREAMLKICVDNITNVFNDKYNQGLINHSIF